MNRWILTDEQAEAWTKDEESFEEQMAALRLTWNHPLITHDGVSVETISGEVLATLPPWPTEQPAACNTSPKDTDDGDL